MVLSFVYLAFAERPLWAATPAARSCRRRRPPSRSHSSHMGNASAWLGERFKAICFDAGPELRDPQDGRLEARECPLYVGI